MKPNKKINLSALEEQRLKLDTIKKIFSGKLFLAISFFAGVPIVIFDAGVVGIIIFLALISGALLLAKNPVIALAPGLIVCTIIFKWYLVSSKFIPYAPLLVIPMAVMILRCVKENIRFQPGGTFPGLIAVTAAILLGGLGTITKEEYFDFWNLYYLAAMGLGMIVFYILNKKLIVKDQYDETKILFFRILYITALFCCFLIIHILIINGQEIYYTERLPEELEYNPMRNLISSMMVIAMPSIFFFAKKNNWHILTAVLTVLCCFLTGSRGGIVLGGIQFFLGMLYLLVTKKSCRGINLAIVLGIVSIGLLNLDKFLSFYSSRFSNGFIQKGEVRISLIVRGIQDFSQAPLLGKGIGYTGNYDLYAPKNFEMPWYHNSVIQIMASMGMVGIAAYIYRLATRIHAIFRKMDEKTPIFLLIFIGNSLVSLIEPGEFSPIPFGIIAVFMFLLLDSPNNQDKNDPAGIQHRKSLQDILKIRKRKEKPHEEHETKKNDPDRHVRGPYLRGNHGNQSALANRICQSR